LPASVDELVALFDLEDLDVNLFRGRQPDTELQRVFGGQVAAQALLAGTRTVDPAFVAHSLHSYFLLPGDTAVPIIYDVERLRDGRSFATRRVVARQHGRPIFYLTVSYQRHEEGFEHQDAMPDVLPPEEGLDLREIFAGRGAGGRPLAWEKEWAALDVRHVGVSGQGLPADPARPAQARLWIRVNGELPADPVQHLAAFTYASDMTLLGSTLVPHGVYIGSPGMQAASLDHTVWFHRPFRADEWWLYDQESPSASGGRGLALARVFTQDGVLAATVAQEGLIRHRG
jgi:acyl-CoA thioesterase-2